MDLHNRVAIVTGAGQGMGRGIAAKLAEYGASVVISGRTESKLLEAAREIEAGGGVALAVKADVSIVSDIKNLFEECRKYFGPPDIMVANAGLSYSSSLSETTEEEYYKVFDINAKGTFFCLKEAGLRLKDGGSVVVISSSTVIHPKNGMSLYSSSKAAVNMMTMVAAQELSARGITVNTVSPGLTITPAMEAGDLPNEFKQAIIENTPFNRLGTVEDIAEIVAFLCSKNAKWINGRNIVADGGCLI